MAWALPGRADHVGSLLRPARLKSARADFEHGRIDANALRQIEDQCIRQVVARQEAIGLQAVTDGEFRRAWWHFDYLAGLAGVEVAESEHGIQFHGVQTKSQKIVVTGRVDFEQHYMLEHFRFLHGVAGATAKMTIPSPSVLHFRGGPGLHQPRRLPRPGRILQGCGGGLSQSGAGVLCRGMPVSAIRRHGVGLSLLRKRTTGRA